MLAPRYSPPQDGLSTKPDSRYLAADLILTLWHKLHCFKCHQPHTSCCHQPRIPASYHSLASSLWYFIPALIHERRYEFSTSWAIWSYKLICLLGITLEKDQKNWFPTCNSAWFWGICYSAKLFYPMHSFKTWLPYHGLVSGALMYNGGSAGKRSSTLGAWRIILPRFLTISRDQSLFYVKLKDDIRSWTRKACSKC